MGLSTWVALYAFFWTYEVFEEFSTHIGGHGDQRINWRPQSKLEVSINQKIHTCKNWVPWTMEY